MLSFAAFGYSICIEQSLRQLSDKLKIKVLRAAKSGLVTERIFLSSNEE